jgi:hypothetical protein
MERLQFGDELISNRPRSGTSLSPLRRRWAVRSVWGVTTAAATAAYRPDRARGFTLDKADPYYGLAVFVRIPADRPDLSVWAGVRLAIYEPACSQS